MVHACPMSYQWLAAGQFGQDVRFRSIGSAPLQRMGQSPSGVDGHDDAPLPGRVHVRHG
jgi:hypothetical protein